jgi:hypothetical protein
MTPVNHLHCPHCRAIFDPELWPQCPSCGAVDEVKPASVTITVPTCDDMARWALERLGDDEWEELKTWRDGLRKDEV